MYWHFGGLTRSFWLERKRKTECAAFARFTVSPYLAMAFFNEFLAEDQPQPGSLFIGGALSGEVVVDRKQILQVALGNAPSCIGKGYEGLSVFFFRPDLYLPAGVGEFDGIAQ